MPQSRSSRYLLRHRGQPSHWSCDSSFGLAAVASTSTIPLLIATASSATRLNTTIDQHVASHWADSCAHGVAARTRGRASFVEALLESFEPVQVGLLKAARPARGWLQPDELADLLDACTDRSRALVATMAYAGLRVSETARLRWRAVDLANGRIAVEASKTDAGRRVISDLNPERLDRLQAHRLQSKRTGPDDLVFGTATGREKKRSSISRQVLKAALDRANSKRVKQGQPPIARATAHDLRRTFAALCYAAGATPPAVMAAMGHTSAALALEVYAKVVAGSTKGLGESMARLVRGPDWAQTGTNRADAAPGIVETANAASDDVVASSTC